MKINTKLILGAILIIWGLGSLLNFDIWRVVWPILIILLGLKIVSGEKYPTDEKTESKEGSLDYSVVFSSVNKKIVSKNFSGGKISTIFGGGEIDLSEAEIKNEEAELKIETIFGGLKIIVPKNWEVKVAVDGIAGAMEDRTKNDKKETKKNKLLITGTAIFGGGEVTN